MSKKPKVNVLPIEQGATPDPQNANKHTARGGARRLRQVKGSKSKINSNDLHRVWKYEPRCKRNGGVMRKTRKVIYGIALWILSPIIYAIAWFQVMRDTHATH